MGLTDAADELHKLVLARVDKLMDAAPGTPEAAELDTLSTAVEQYESVRWPMNDVVKLRPNETPDWRPTRTAVGLAEGYEQRGSTGQLWRVVEGQWVRVRGNEL